MPEQRSSTGQKIDWRECNHDAPSVFCGACMAWFWDRLFAVYGRLNLNPWEGNR